MAPRSVTTLATGKFAEDLAFNYLLQLGLRPLARNYRSHRGEIDIIMQHEKTIVFIEVRYRKNDHYMSPLETISSRKCKRIIETSWHYLQSNRNATKNPCRFDVITISGDQAEPDIMWIKNAFQA